MYLVRVDGDKYDAVEGIVEGADDSGYGHDVGSSIRVDPQELHGKLVDLGYLERGSCVSIW